MNQILKAVSIGLILIGAMGLVGVMDYQDEVRSEEHYCYMRAVWEANKDIVPQKRPGWPNFKPEVKCP